MCNKCQGKGWVESYQGVSASWTPSLQQCPNRCNISGYSSEVQRRLNNPAHVTERPVFQARDLDPARPRRPALRLIRE